MFYRINKKLYSIFKMTLRILLCLQLSLCPIHGYSASTKDNQENVAQSLDTTFLDQLRDKFTKDHPELIEKIQPLVEIAEAIEKGEVEKYLAQNSIPDYEKDYFLISDQRVDAIEYHFDSEKNKVIQTIGNTLNLNDYKSSALHIIFKEVHVQYDKNAKELIFEGVIGERVVLRQHVPNMDIIDYANDKEILVLVDRKKGLLLADMIFTRGYLGIAPIPFTRVQSTSLNEHLTARNQLPSIEFINRSIRPPDVIPESIQNLDLSFKKESLFTAGDLMLSHTDSNNKKHLIQFVKRNEMKGWLKLTYKMLDFMVKTVAPHLIQKKDLKDFSEKIDSMAKEQPNIFIQQILSSLFTKNAIQKLVQTKEAIQERSNQLEQLSPRDKMQFEEWKRSFEAIAPKIEQNIKKQQQITGDIFNSKTIAELHHKQKNNKDEQKDTKAKAFQIIANITSRFKNGNSRFIKFVTQNKLLVGTVGASGLAGFMFPEKFIALVNTVFPIIGNTIHYEAAHAYIGTTVPHLLTMLVALPATIILLSYIFVPAIKKIKQLTPKSLNFGQKVYHPKGHLQDILDKWGKTTISQRIVGIGLKFVAYTIYPFWNYLASMIGQPHFFPALQKGLNPFKKIEPRSDIGQLIQIDRATRLGSQGWNPHWKKKSENFHKQRQLQNATIAKERRMKTISWLMATLAVTHTKKVDPISMLVYGATSLDLSKIAEMHNNKALRVEILWVMKNLLKEIRQLDEVDIRKEIADLDPKVILRYYEKAKELATKVHSDSPFRKTIRSVLATNLISKIGKNITLRKVTGINKDQHDLLKNVPSDFVTNRVVTEFLSDHMLVSILPILTTERAEFGFEDTSKLSVEFNSPVWSNKPHLQEVWLNVIAHFFIAGGQRTMTFSKKQTTMQNIFTQSMSTYEPVVKYLEKTKAKQQTDVEYTKSYVSYLAKGGGKADNLGGVMWRSYMSRLRSLQMTFSLMVGARLLLTDQSLGEAAFAFLLYHLAAQWIFGWPWDILSGGAKYNDNKLKKNIERIEILKNNVSELEREVFESEKKMQNQYRDSIREVVKLYNINPALKKQLLNSGIKEIDPKLWTYMKESKNGNWMDVPVSQNVKTIQLIAQKLIKLITQNPPVPVRANQTTNFIFVTAFGAILTTYLFVTLSILTFNPEFLNWKFIGMWALINYTAYATIYWLYSKQFKDHFTFLKSWKNYFSTRILHSKAANQCRQIFSKK